MHPPSPSPMNPGDEVPPGTPFSGGNLCSRCSGEGKRHDGTECRHCGGSGRVHTIISE